jgi:hypothetical protein
MENLYKNNENVFSEEKLKPKPTRIGTKVLRF